MEEQESGSKDHELLLELKTKQHLLEARMQALVNILSREGVITKVAVDEEVERLVELKDEKK
jgi:hypothetical protein